IGPELAGLLGAPLAVPERDKARSMVSSSSGIAATVELGRSFAERAEMALRKLSSRSLAAALGELTQRLFDDLPCPVS
ncbi:MAG: hypothetical protein ACRDVP_07980, partial [Acidimicrobiales bacterium]